MLPAKFITSSVHPAELPEDRAHVAMVGRSNVGKSSLINHLTGQKALARVSSEPGRTQTINLYDIDGRFYLADMPGYGFAKFTKGHRAIFAEMIMDYLEETEQLRLVLMIIDARMPPTALDQQMIEWLRTERVPFVLVLNKVDKAKTSEKTKLVRELTAHYPGVRLIEHSVSSGKQRDELLVAIEEAIV